MRGMMKGRNWREDTGFTAGLSAKQVRDFVRPKGPAKGDRHKKKGKKK
jgi:hypothetical protein